MLLIILKRVRSRYNYLFIYLYIYSLKSIKLLHSINIESRSTPNPQYNMLNRLVRTSGKIEAPILLIDKTFMLQKGFTHSAWTGLTFSFPHLLEQF